MSIQVIYKGQLKLYIVRKKFENYFYFFNSFLDVIDKQALNIVPYAKHLMLPCIQCMTHQDWYIRSIASNCFAVLIKYYALNVRILRKRNKSVLYYLNI
jgi:hypothetical protein